MTTLRVGTTNQGKLQEFREHSRLSRSRPSGDYSQPREERKKCADDLQLTDLIPGWSNLAAAQRVNRWFHVTVALQAIHVTIPRFHQILIFNRGDGAASRPHFRMANVELGWVDGLTPPAVSLQSATPNLSCDQLALTFTTDQATRYQIEYGIGNYGQVFQGPADEWSSTHTATLTGLHPGSNYQYRIVALDHRTDPTAAPNQGVYAGNYAMLATPIALPTITGLAVSNIAANNSRP